MSCCDVVGGSVVVGVGEVDGLVDVMEVVGVVVVVCDVDVVVNGVVVVVGVDEGVGSVVVVGPCCQRRILDGDGGCDD